ncbi:MAG: luciferase family protein [Acidimicrobiales bacterium]
MWRALATLALLVVGACSSESSVSSASDSPTANPAIIATREAVFTLPEREGARRATTGAVPHVQLDAEPVPTVDAELRRRVFQLPGVENRESDRSLPGARGLALADDLVLERPDVISGSSEFAHIHPDGSMHVWLPVDRAVAVDEAKWGELHPWVDRNGFWDGVVMIYTPETLDELEVALVLVVDAYNFVTGASLTPSDIS